MKVSFWPLAAVAVVVLGVGCSFSGLPQPGDTVSPRLAQEINWTAGAEGELWVQLVATPADGSARSLSFAASPVNNPLAAISFYDAGGALVKTAQVQLAERC